MSSKFLQLKSQLLHSTSMNCITTHLMRHYVISVPFAVRSNHPQMLRGLPEIKRIEASLRQRVHLECNVNDTGEALWQKRVNQSTSLLFIGVMPAMAYNLNNVVLSQEDYSITIEPFKIENEGNYICLDNGQVVVEYTLAPKGTNSR